MRTAGTIRICDLLEPVVSGLGYEFVGVEFESSARILRVFIDAPAGITVDDCSKVSHQISGVLDVEDPIPGEYRLEVSSPGLDRLLFKPEDFDRFTGHLARIQLKEPLQEQRKFRGRLLGRQGNDVLLEDAGNALRIPIHMIGKARLVPEI